MEEYKQVIVVRSDLKLPKGKMAGQAAHASVECVLRMLKNRKHSIVNAWRSEGMKKVVAKVGSLKELLKVLQEAKDFGLPCCSITDAGKTVIAPGTMTCIGIGPAKEEDIDVVTSELKLM